MSKKTKKTEYKPSINFSTIWDSDYWLHSNGMYCGFNMPDALADSESAQSLPPYAKRKFYLADEYPACPKNWVPSEGRKTSYFVPVKEGQGMWLDFTKNEDNKYHVAVVVSIQGINPITGLPCKDAALEQYIDNCPKHNESFGPNRFCKSCGYKWPKQNYICTTGTPNGNLWLDGFRAADGIVRQYILTMDKIKGVASNIISEDRVFAVGISFFFSNNPKPVVMQTSVTRGIYKMSKGGGTASGNYGTYIGNTASGGYVQCSSGLTKGSMSYTSSLGDRDIISSASAGGMSAGAPAGAADAAPSEDMNMDWMCERGIVLNDESSSIYSIQDITAPDLICGSYNRKSLNSPGVNIQEVDHSIKSISVKKIEIGAGSNISQQIHDDPEPLEFWRKEPESIIVINYCLEESCEKIIKAGRISLEGHGEAFLKDIPKGNEKVLEEK